MTQVTSAWEKVTARRFETRRSASQARLLGFLATVLALVLALQASRMAALGNDLGLAAIVGAATLSAVLVWPRAAVLALLLLTGTFFYVPIGQVAAAGSRSDIAELLAAVLIVAFGSRELFTRERPRAPTVGLVLLVGAVAVGAVWSGTHGGLRGNIVGDSKTYGLYLLVLPLGWIFAEESSKKWLEGWVLRLATVGGALTLLAVATSYPLEGKPGLGLVQIAATEADRVRPPLLPLLFLATLLLVSRITLRGWSARRLAALAVYLAVWAVSFNRSSWAALAFACVLLVVFRKGPRQPKRFVVSLLAASVLLPATFILSATGALGVTAVGVANRLASISQQQTYSSSYSSFEDRAQEYTDARRALAKGPVFGVGVGNTYGARRATYSPALDAIVYSDRSFSHNSLLYLYLQLGALGLIAFLCLSVQIARRCYRSVVVLPLPSAGRAAAAGFALMGAGLESLANPNLLGRANIVMFCVAVVLLTPPRDSRGGAS